MPQPPNRPRTGAQLSGDAAEELVAARLAADGWTILGRNVHVGRYELDLVAVDPGPPPALVVVEVRARRTRDFGLAEETVDHRKRVRVHQAAYG
ncbi:MAG: YraN family protein, partial [Chloroflexi bacterium]|nr:YraN family protein [Chloroflexota bacterium]